MNRQSNLYREIPDGIIRKIFAHTLQEETVWETALLDGGMFNTTYLVEYGPHHSKAVLRLGPVNRHLLMGFEENLMNAEVYAYSVCQAVGVPCSKVLVCDTSKQLIDRDFMITEYIPSVVMANAGLTEESRSRIYRLLGVYLAKLHLVTGESFGFLSRICSGKKFSTWSDALIFEVEDISGRLERLGGLTEGEAQAVRRLFYKSRELLDEIKTPHLLHTDLWEGNVLLDADTLEIAAIIDSDRAMYGDRDFEFSSPWMKNAALREGYRSVIPETDAPNGEKRRALYRMFFFLLEAYVGYGEYNQPELYQTRKKQLMEHILCFPCE